jgi:protein gp37
MKQAHRFSGKGQAYEGLTRIGPNGPTWTGAVRLVEDALTEPLHWRKPQRIFVNSMSDLFHEDVPDTFIDRVFAVMALCPQHTFQLLTKRADRMRDYMLSRSTSAYFWKAACPDGYAFDYQGISLLPFPLPNVWLGVSVENQRFADERIPLLLQTPAAVRFISAEPLLGPVDLTRVQTDTGVVNALWNYERRDDAPAPWSRIEWVIVGGESGPGARVCDVAWVRSIVQQCQAAGVPVFVKQLSQHPWHDGIGAPPIGAREADHVLNGRVGWLYTLRDRKGGAMDEWPADLRIRQYPGERARPGAQP